MYIHILVLHICIIYTRYRYIDIRSICTLRIVGPRIFESTFRNYCTKKLDGALRKSTSFVQEFA